MSAASTTTVATTALVTPPSSPKLGPKVCPGAPARPIRSNIQPLAGVIGRRLEFGNMGDGAAGAAALAHVQGQMAAMGLGGQGSQ